MRLDRWLPRATLTSDVGVALVAIASITAITAGIEPDGERALDTLGYATIVLCCGALATRRTAPLLTIAVITAGLTVYLLREYPGGPVYLTLFVALYSLASMRELRPALVVAAVSTGALVVLGTVTGTGPGLVHLVYASWSAAAVFLGTAVRNRRAYHEGLEERAATLEHSREAEARRRVSEERLRIARDIHDTVAHAMTAINVQSGVAAHLMEPDHPARPALESMRTSSRDVLVELQALLRLLRDDPDGADRLPTPDLLRLRDLVEASASHSGLDVALAVDGDLTTVPTATSVAAYRIVQESLTNVVRHAGPGAAARVEVRVGGPADGSSDGSGGGLAVEVSDDGGSTPVAVTADRGARADRDAAARRGRGGNGVGIMGMRERAASTGGSLDARPRANGGFRVRATWPADPAAR